jgi:hypothetical protein
MQKRLLHETVPLKRLQLLRASSTDCWSGEHSTSTIPNRGKYFKTVNCKP